MFIQITIDRFEGDKAILKTNEGETIIWSKNKLPIEAKEGSVLNFKITSDLEEEKEKKALAKEILNEILDVKE